MTDINISCVQTKNGPVSGFKITTYRDNNDIFKGVCDINAFWGIPYAKPPVGNLRFKPPQPCEPWTEVRKCEGHPVAMQKDFFQDWDFDCTLMDMSEDCLYVDIWSPAKASDEKLPVMVWFHGGAYVAGSALLPKYDMTNLARKGAVIVSVEYRLGIFAYLAHKWLTAESEEHVSGNNGFLDCIAALKWVKANIAAFGGDPDNITTFGESSGGSIMSFFLTSPLTEGLISKVIVESGTGQPTELLTMEEAEKIGEIAVERLGCKSLEQLRALPASAILDVAAALREEQDLRWEVCKDGVIIVDHVFNRFKEGKFNKFNTIFLTMEQDSPFEAELGDPSGGEEPEMKRDKFGRLLPTFTNAASYKKYLETFYGSEIGKQLAEAVPVTDEMTPAEIKKTAGDLFSFFQADVRGRFYAQQIGDAGGKSYVVQWAKVPEGWVQLGKGAFHELELAYLFRNLWPGYPKPQWSVIDKKWSDALQTYWIQFAKTGNPNGNGLPLWPKYNDATEYLYFGETEISVKENNTRAAEILFPLFEKRYAEIDAGETKKGSLW